MAVAPASLFQHVKHPSAIDTFPVFVHKAFTGEVLVRHVHSEMPIEELRSQFQEGLPAFHEANLLLEDSILDKGTCADLRALQDAQIKLVVKASTKLALTVIEQTRASLSEQGVVSTDFHDLYLRCLEALAFLEEQGVLCVQQSSVLLDYITEIPAAHYSVPGDSNSVHKDVIIQNVAAVFGRTCDVELFGPKIAILVRDHSFLDDLKFLSVLIALHEAALRNKDACPKQELSAFLKTVVDGWEEYSLAVLFDSMDESNLVQRALLAACHLAYEFASADVFQHFKVELGKRLPSFTGDLHELVVKMLSDVSEPFEEHTVQQADTCLGFAVEGPLLSDGLEGNGLSLDSSAMLGGAKTSDLEHAVAGDDVSLAQPLLESEADMHPDGQAFSPDGFTILRLARKAGSPCVLAALLSSPALAHCRERLASAGCEMAPDWACGAKLLVPLTNSMFDDITFNGQRLENSHHHIVALGSDTSIIRAAFREISEGTRPDSEEKEANAPVDFSVIAGLPRYS